MSASSRTDLYLAADSVERRQSLGHSLHESDQQQHQVNAEAAASLAALPTRIDLQEEVAVRALSDPFALMLIDLDRFKMINDSLGHSIGDVLLSRVASRLKASVREEDMLARLGGDEFAILIQLTPDADIFMTRIAARIVEMVGRPYLIHGQQMHVGASIGIAVAPQHGCDWNLLFRNAELALYKSKSAGGNCTSFFQSEMATQALSRRALEMDLRKAIALSEFELHYQPQVDLRSNSLIGFEALLRWNHPQRGFVPPIDFIPLAEEIGLIKPIGDWVLRSACKTAAAWPNHLKVAVNVSPIQFESDRLVASVRQALANASLPGHRLELEITEGVLLRYDTAAVAILSELKAMHCQIAMDDFGTGYASLSQLASFPFDKIKIDRSFMGAGAENSSRRAIVKAIASIGAALGFNTMAEGVESVEQLENIRIDGCDSVQGYIYSKPIPGSAVDAMISNLNGGSYAPVSSPKKEQLP